MEKDHEKWLMKFNKRKEGKIFNLLKDIEMCVSNFKIKSCENQKSHLSAALWILAKNTKTEEDVRRIIEIMNPEFFKED